MPEPTITLTHAEAAGLAFESAGAASVPFMQDHPDYVMPTERISVGVAEVLLERGVDISTIPGYGRASRESA